ncbi:cyclase family protein [Spongiactinospora sp. TRM90649]|uniref:cyclase family protein n=1 Tax=Spongiactinospora sp. TRM90649 TaxID=3031114 RepID=UPI0023F8BB25|nr:cyclase family protein [Spongiactinospora sp. TRM90649]MDF5753430.1 cyclase family protein [Spongiactinospora sp. TRM90649]
MSDNPASGANRQVATSPYGPEDEIGRLNLMSPESRAAVISRIDATEMFDLSVDYFIGMPSWQLLGDPAYQIWMTHTPHGTVVDELPGISREMTEYISYSGDTVMMYTHTGTHIDTLNHYGYNGRIYNNFTEREHLGTRHWRVAGADKMPPIVARGVLLDFAGLRGVDMLPDQYGITPEDVDECLATQGVEIQLGDVVLSRTGRMRAWPDATAWGENPPGLTRAAAVHLVEKGAMIVGSDTVCVEQGPSTDPDNYTPVHTYLLAEAGAPLIEVLDLEALAAAEVYEFGFFAACLRLRGATGAPLRPWAFPFRKD